jgi:hypothetical protein
MLTDRNPWTPPRTACDICKQTPSDWFIYLTTEPQSAYTFHSQQLNVGTAKSLSVTANQD